VPKTRNIIPYTIELRKEGFLSNPHSSEWEMEVQRRGRRKVNGNSKEEEDYIIL
jgi:hypothetical protein